MARTEGQWQKGISFISPSEDVPVLLKNTYLNFGGDTIGDSGYGIRDNAGTIEIKSFGGSWGAVATGATDISGKQNILSEGAFVDGDKTKLNSAVVGPASATDNAIVRYNGTTGKLVQNSGVIIDDSGNVGINTVAPAYKLDVAGFINTDHHES